MGIIGCVLLINPFKVGGEYTSFGQATNYEPYLFAVVEIVKKVKHVNEMNYLHLS